MKDRIIKLSPPQVLLFVFLIGIIIGTILLKLPFSTTDSISLLDALFTATSAMTVTGLAVVDTGTAFTTFGQVVIMVLIQTGGLGIMSFAILVFIALGRKIGFKQRILVQQALNQTSIGGVIKLVQKLFIFSIIIESIAVCLLAIRWVPALGWKEGIFASVFHSISAFNNAGFSIWSDSLMGYVGDPLVNIIISSLFIIGGLGFTVLADLWSSKKFQRLSLHSKIMIVGTFSLNLLSFFLVFWFEYNNPNTLGKLPFLDKVWGAYFQAVTTRTAGFNSVDIGSLEESTIFLMLILMFIGAGSASTAGGIKLTTFIAMFLSVLTFVKGKEDVTIFRRTLNPVIIVRCLAITMISISIVFIGIFVLEFSQSSPFLPIVFEVISAFGTVGLSMGLTADLTSIGKEVIIIIMFIGKIGPLTLAFSLTKQERTAIRYPKEEILTG
ncbi:TrkH family potassium uptake protein [Bacillus sp. Marseille-P3661]|uniref:TrkH family potassium uptake protein n=1 Tax=Bacillus sp. Marseille-P3661 TaxID=1936234 RepID=UPI000C83B314|nr:TrkH family potassium uptake protein [Bacillus sp. Marseille-P3661]